MSLRGTLLDTIHDLSNYLDDPEWRNSEQDIVLVRLEALRSDLRMVLEDLNKENEEPAANASPTDTIRSSWLRWLSRASNEDVLRFHDNMAGLLGNMDDEPPSTTLPAQP